MLQIVQNISCSLGQNPSVLIFSALVELEIQIFFEFKAFITLIFNHDADLELFEKLAGVLYCWFLIIWFYLRNSWFEQNVSKNLE